MIKKTNRFYSLYFLISITSLAHQLAFAASEDSKKARLFFYRDEKDLTSLYVTNGKTRFEVNSKELYDGLKEEMKEDQDALKFLSESENYHSTYKTFSTISMILLGTAAITFIIAGTGPSSDMRWVSLGSFAGAIPFSLVAQNNLLKSNNSLLKSINKYNGDSYLPEKKNSNKVKYNMGIDPINGSATGYLSFSF